MFFRRGRSERELIALLDNVHGRRLPMPSSEDAGAWDDWIQLEELQSLLAGLVSRQLDGAAPPTATEISQVRVLLASDGLRRVAGERAFAAAELIDRLTPGLVSPGNNVSAATTFLGVSDDPTRDLRSAGTGLFEFWTDTDVPVKLHDMRFEGLDYRIDPRPNLVLRFRYDEEEWTPPDAIATPVVEMTFDDVRVRYWEADEEAWADLVAPQGQVTLFDYIEPAEFELQTDSLGLKFSASRVRVRLDTWGDQRRG